MSLAFSVTRRVTLRTHSVDSEFPGCGQFTAYVCPWCGVDMKSTPGYDARVCPLCFSLVMGPDLRAQPPRSDSHMGFCGPEQLDSLRRPEFADSVTYIDGHVIGE